MAKRTSYQALQSLVEELNYENEKLHIELERLKYYNKQVPVLRHTVDSLLDIKKLLEHKVTKQEHYRVLVIKVIKWAERLNSDLQTLKDQIGEPKQ